MLPVDSRWMTCTMRDGSNAVRIVRKDGRGSIYFGAEARFLSREEAITAAGNETLTLAVGRACVHEPDVVVYGLPVSLGCRELRAAPRSG